MDPDRATEVCPLDNREIPVLLPLLLTPEISAATKVVWMAQRLRPGATTTDLVGLTGLSRPTILTTLARVRACSRVRTGPWVRIPGALLAEPEVGASAKVLYGTLQATAQSRGHRGRFTYATLSTYTKLGPNTLKRAMKELKTAGWIRLTQASRVKPIHFSLGSPALRRAQAESPLAQRRLKRAKYTGEAIMQEYLSLLVASDQFTDNARPGWLINPPTGERLELDRLYAANVAFEFNGAQHYGATARFTQREADSQRERDLVKAGLCVYQGIQLVIIHPEDLSLERMRRKIPQSLPQRDLAGHEPLIDLLETSSLTYVAAVPAAQQNRQ